jgi:hypothetical protein
MKLSATKITLGFYDFTQHMSREKFCAKRLHKINSAPDSSIPFLALDPFGVASFVVAEARDPSRPWLGNLFLASSLFS